LATQLDPSVEYSGRLPGETDHYTLSRTNQMGKPGWERGGANTAGTDGRQDTIGEQTTDNNNKHKSARAMLRIRVRARTYVMQ
jgi:hypothetical protein